MTDAAPFSDRSILITGASSGIGRATAARLASEGADLALLARSRDALESLADRLTDDHGIDTTAYPTDLRKEREVTRTVDAAIEAFGGLDDAVINAGVGCGASAVSELTTEDYRTMMETNVDGAFFVVRETLPSLRERSGNLVFIGSIANRHPHAGNPVYAATKAWLRSFALSLEAQVGPDGVAVSLINPGTVRTPFQFDGEMRQDEKYGTGEAIEPGEIAEAIGYVLQPGSGSTVSEVNIHRRDQLHDLAILGR